MSMCHANRGVVRSRIHRRLLVAGLLALAGEPAARFRVYARLLETTLSDDEADRVRIATRAPRGTISTPFVK